MGMLNKKEGIEYYMIKYILFDLDGTLTDPKIGITSCVQYALKHFGIEEPNLDKLEPFIGPPLKDSFMEYYNFTEEQAEEAIEKYRERFQTIGIFENKLYKGIPGLLKYLKSEGRHLAIASSKPTVFVERILEHFKIKRYFDVVIGSELDGTRGTKEEVVKEALNQLFDGKPVDRAQTVMIGDRKFDIQGAKSWFIQSIGVTYGYGSEEELKQAGANYIVKDVKQLQELLLAVEMRVKNEPPLRKIWLIVLPFLTFFMVRQLTVYIGLYILKEIYFVTSGTVFEKFLQMTSDGQMGLTNYGINILSTFSFVIAGIAIWYLNRPLLKKTEERAKLLHPKRENVVTYLLMGISCVGLALGFNILFYLTGFTQSSESFQEVSKTQYSVSMLLGLLIYGVIAPISEEIAFRGVLYNRVKKIFNPSVGIVMTSVFFAIYHGNVVQGVFAFLMGMVITYLYEEFGYLYIAILAHSIMNLTAYMISNIEQSTIYLANWYVCVCVLVIGFISLLILHSKNHYVFFINKNK